MKSGIKVKIYSTDSVVLLVEHVDGFDYGVAGSIPLRNNFFFHVRKLDGQQTNHRICLKLYNMICLSIHYYL